MIKVDWTDWPGGREFPRVQISRSELDVPEKIYQGTQEMMTEKGRRKMREDMLRRGKPGKRSQDSFNRGCF